MTAWTRGINLPLRTESLFLSQVRVCTCPNCTWRIYVSPLFSRIQVRSFSPPFECLITYLTDMLCFMSLIYAVSHDDLDWCWDSLYRCPSFLGEVLICRVPWLIQCLVVKSRAFAWCPALGPLETRILACLARYRDFLHLVWSFILFRSLEWQWRVWNDVFTIFPTYR